MNAIVKEFPGEEGTFFRTDVKEPSPGYGQVKVKVMAASQANLLLFTFLVL